MKEVAIMVTKQENRTKFAEMNENWIHIFDFQDHLGGMNAFTFKEATSAQAENVKTKWLSSTHLISIISYLHLCKNKNKRTNKKCNHKLCSFYFVCRWRKQDDMIPFHLLQFDIYTVRYMFALL